VGEWSRVWNHIDEVFVKQYWHVMPMMVGRWVGVQLWGTAVNTVLRRVLGFLLESYTADRVVRIIWED